MDGMCTDFDQSRAVQFPDHVPGEIAFLSHKASNDEGRGMETMCAQDWESVLVEVAVSIIEGENDWVGWGWN